MKSKQIQLNDQAGIYLRLSKDDDQVGESLSIENQRMMLQKYVAEHGLKLIDEYVDDGYSGTTFDRPEVQRLLDDAKSGRINVIIVKDLSRFGRNYIEVGMYVDYVFPAHSIRFIALSDNVDTGDKNSSGVEMMPIMNVFNEWHAANTSKKIRAVFETKAKMGKYKTTFAAYGYKKGTDDRKLPVRDEPAASIVRRIFEMRASGQGRRKIAAVLTREGIPNPAYYRQETLGAKVHPNVRKVWSTQTVWQILNNPIYLGHLVQLKQTTVSYKNKKIVKRPKSEWVIVKNTHEPIISQELWDKVQEMNASVSRGKSTKQGEVKPLSGLMYCPECGAKMRLVWTPVVVKGVKTGERKCAYNCSAFTQMGKLYCNSKAIQEPIINEIVLQDIRSKANLVWTDEERVRTEFLRRKAQLSAMQIKASKKKLESGQKRLEELSRLTQAVYEDKVMGRIPENVCVELLNKYQTEKATLQNEVAELEKRVMETQQDEADVDEFIRRIKNYVDVKELTREMCMELIEYITIGLAPKDKAQPREIHIYYKLLDKETAEEHRNKIKNIV